ncbi:protein AMBP-like protein [Lates japonicus]|uniref:Protein AMBP-like protein n=1 Tax=Lates japonicus TaxID=270547 RepID=A0AAD3RAD8_LATJO|nr:protein AMBP-like protein [Lates japonicus]
MNVDDELNALCPHCCWILSVFYRQVDTKTDRMQKAVILVSVLILGWTWTLQGLPVQEDVDVDQIEYEKWLCHWKIP